jgi:hypothetical protein
MPERKNSSQDDGWQDIHLDDIAKGVNSFFAMVSDVVERLGANNNSSRRYQMRSAGSQSAPSRLGAGSALAGVRDPVVDLFDEGSEILLLVEWSYTDEAPLSIDLQDDVLSLSIGGDHPYTTDVLLPYVVDASSVSQSCRNGITTLRLRRA